MVAKNTEPKRRVPAPIAAAGEKVGEKMGELLGGKNAVRSIRSKLLVSVINKGEERKLKEILDGCTAALSVLFAGMGTANSAVLDYLGIGDSEKTILLSLFPESDEENMMREIREKMALYRVGRGISFTVPLTGVSQTVADGLASAANNKTTERAAMNRETRKYDLVVTSVSADHVDRAMEVARKAGAAGGTIIRARTTDNAKAEQFIGISLMLEQEVLLILTRRENTAAIMNALAGSVGVKTEARGIIFSVPVDRTAGISIDEDREAEQ